MTNRLILVSCIWTGLYRALIGWHAFTSSHSAFLLVRIFRSCNGGKSWLADSFSNYLNTCSYWPIDHTATDFRKCWLADRYVHNFNFQSYSWKESEDIAVSNYCFPDWYTYICIYHLNSCSYWLKHLGVAPDTKRWLVDLCLRHSLHSYWG